MAGRARAVELVVEWLETQLKARGFRAGDAVPSERVLAERFRVARGVVREAKSQLRGRGVLVQDRHRLRFATRDAGSLYADWLSQVAAEARGRQKTALRDLLRLHCFVLPQAMALASRRASPAELNELLGYITDLRTCFELGRDAMEAAFQHQNVLDCSANLSRSPMLVALSAGLAQIMRGLPIWEVWLHQDYSAWRTALGELLLALNQRDGSSVRRLLRRHLRSLEARFLGTASA